MHDVLSGNAVARVLHFYNKTPIDWHCKEQSTPEPATYGAKFITRRTRVEQIIDHWNSLRHWGIPINDISYVFGEHKSLIINNSTVPHTKLHKKNNGHKN